MSSSFAAGPLTTRRTVLVTGASGFIGKNLLVALERRSNVVVRHFAREHSFSDLDVLLAEADVVFHLAGVTRPADEADFERVNVGLTAEICARLERLGRAPLVALASSSQADLDNPYGWSKRRAERELRRFAGATGSPTVAFRLRNVFGKWCKPNCSSVVATYCHKVARGLPISVTDPDRELSFVYVDDVVQAFLDALDKPPGRSVCERREVGPAYPMTLGELAEQIIAFRDSRQSLVLPDYSDRFTRCLYATYLSHLGEGDFAYPLPITSDVRGEFAQLLSSSSFGQVFVSRTKPGTTDGNHFHHTKAEKVLVLEGSAVVRFRSVLDCGASHSGDRVSVGQRQVIEYAVSGSDFEVIDIPPGYAHSVENVGEGELVALFWASEVFDARAPDTYSQSVLENAAVGNLAGSAQ